MTRDHSTGRVFSVIQGGGADLAARPAGSDVSKRFESLAEIKIAGELGLLYFLGLVADCPVSALTDPHTLLRFGRAMPVELNELLCELRNLSWFDSRAFHLPDTHPDAAHRASHWNSAGQLTRNTVFNAGLRPVIGTYRASCLWSSQSGPVMSFRDMAGCLKGVDAGDCMSEAVRLVSAGDTGQRGQGGLTLTRDALLEHLDHAARQAIEETYRQDAHSCKSDRPPVIAAQIAMTMSGDSRDWGPASDILRKAASHLAQNAPQLLSWVNEHQGGPWKNNNWPYQVFLPLGGATHRGLQASATAAHLTVAAAQATILKALFGKRTLSSQTTGCRQPILMERELDLFVSQIGLARMVCAASFSSSIHDAVRKGQEIGLQTLREMLETANVPAGLSLSDVDGRLWEMVCRPRGFGRGYVSIFIDGKAADWSGETSRRGGHLTEVV